MGTKSKPRETTARSNLGMGPTGGPARPPQEDECTGPIRVNVQLKEVVSGALVILLSSGNPVFINPQGGSVSAQLVGESAGPVLRCLHSGFVFQGNLDKEVGPGEAFITIYGKQS